MHGLTDRRIDGIDGSVAQAQLDGALAEFSKTKARHDEQLERLRNDTVCRCACACVCAFVCTRAGTRTRARARVCMRVRVHTHTCAHMVTVCMWRPGFDMLLYVCGGQALTASENTKRREELQDEIQQLRLSNALLEQKQHSLEAERSPVRVSVAACGCGWLAGWLCRLLCYDGLLQPWAACPNALAVNRACRHRRSRCWVWPMCFTAESCGPYAV